MRLLWISNDPRLLTVGQSRVAREILGRLHSLGVEVHATAIGRSSLRSTVPYTVHPWDAEPWAYPKALIASLKPDVIVCSHDCWLFYWLKECRRDFPNIKLVGYYTIDGGPIHGSWIQTMQPLDLLLSPTEFGKKEIYARYPEKHIGVIPYGVDHKVFNLPSSKAVVKSETDARTASVAKDTVKLSSKCIFSYVGQNQGRKNVAAIADGFEMANLTNSHLIILAHSTVAALGGWQGTGDFDLVDMLGTFEHRERITVAIDGTDDSTIASLYRCADYFVLPTQGEAPGLPIIEAMACGCIPIVTDYSGATEVAAGYKLPYTFLRGQFNVNRAIVSAESVALAMTEAYKSWEAGLNEPLIAECIRVAGVFSWEKTVQLWLAYLEGLLADEVLVDTELQVCL